MNSARGVAAERDELKIVDDQLGAPTCAADLAKATTKILAGIIANGSGRPTQAGLSGTYHMTASGQTNWYEFSKIILEEAARAPHDLPWLAALTTGRPLIARRVVPISTAEFGSRTVRPPYSVLCNARLKEAFGVALPDWRTQLQKCFSAERVFFPTTPQ